MSLEEYLSAVYESDREWVNGEVIERNRGELDHSAMQAVLLSFLAGQRERAGIYVYPELRMQLEPSRYRIPDIAVTTKRGKGRILTDPPFLCIEIVSPEDRMSRMEAKIAEYLRCGVSYVWLIDPRQRRAWSYTAGGRTDCATALTTLSPDLTIQLTELFRELDEQIEP